MKGFLFGLGAMIIGAGLMFVLMHREVEAETSDKALELYCERGDVGFRTGPMQYCKVKDLTCILWEGRQSVA